MFYLGVYYKWQPNIFINYKYIKLYIIQLVLYFIKPFDDIY